MEKKKKGGRPRKCKDFTGKKLEDCLNNEVFSKYVGLKFTKNEFDLLFNLYQKTKGNMSISFSEFLRYILLNKDFSKIKEKENNANLIREINKIGININQISKKINSVNYLSDDVKLSLDKVKNELENIIKIVFQIKK